MKPVKTAHRNLRPYTECKLYANLLFGLVMYTSISHNGLYIYIYIHIPPEYVAIVLPSKGVYSVRLIALHFIN